MEKTKKAKKQLEDVLGVTNKDLLLDLIGEIKLLKKDIPVLDKLEQQLADNQKVEVKHLQRLIKVAKGLKVDIPDQLNVKVVNQKEFPKEIAINNLGDIVIPKPPSSVEIKEAGWLVNNLLKITGAVDDLVKRTFNVSLDNHTLPPDKALPVRLVSRGGQFYTARGGGTTTVSGSPKRIKIWDGDYYAKINPKGYFYTEDGNYATRVAEDSGDSNVTYVGKAQIGSATDAEAWQIMKVDETSGTIIQWADGDDSFNNVWDDRESLSYS